MKRNFITGIAMMVAAFFFGTELAQAADISFSGKIRTRYEKRTGRILQLMMITMILLLHKFV